MYVEGKVNITGFQTFTLMYRQIIFFHLFVEGMFYNIFRKKNIHEIPSTYAY